MSGNTAGYYEAFRTPRVSPVKLLPIRGHAKVVRFVRRLTDRQVLELIATVERTTKQSECKPSDVRAALIRFVEAQP